MRFSEKSLFNIKRDVGRDDTDILKKLVAEEDLRLDQNSDYQSKFNHTIVRKGELLHRMVRSGIMTQSSLINHKNLLEPVLPTSLQPVERDVTDVMYLDDNYGNQRIVIVVDDDDMLLRDERKLYLNRASKKQFEIHAPEPQITLTRIPRDRATLGLLATVSSEIPEVIHLNPVSTSFPNLMPRSMQIAKRSAENSRQVAPNPVHNLQKIPQGLIDSLKRIDTSTDAIDQSI